MKNLTEKNLNSELIAALQDSDKTGEPIRLFSGGRQFVIVREEDYRARQQSADQPAGAGHRRDLEDSLLEIVESTPAEEALHHREKPAP